MCLLNFIICFISLKCIFIYVFFCGCVVVEKCKGIVSNLCYLVKVIVVKGNYVVMFKGYVVFG